MSGQNFIKKLNYPPVIFAVEQAQHLVFVNKKKDLFDFFVNGVKNVIFFLRKSTVFFRLFKFQKVPVPKADVFVKKIAGAFSVFSPHVRKLTNGWAE